MSGNLTMKFLYYNNPPPRAGAGINNLGKPPCSTKPPDKRVARFSNYLCFNANYIYLMQHNLFPELWVPPTQAKATEDSTDKV